MREHNNFKYTCLFGGGAIRGTAHVGVLKALQELGIEIDSVGGSSVGSLAAGLYAVGYSYQEISEIFLAVNFELFRDISLGFNQKFALSKGEVFLDWIRDLIEKKFYGDKYVKGQCEKVKFRDLSKNLYIITTNLKDFTCREFSNIETPDFEVAMALRISCCMPGLMRALHLQDELLVDGDLLKGKPMWTLSKNLKNCSNRILEIRLEGTFEGSDESPIEYVNGMYSCMTSASTEFIKSVFGNHDKYDCLVVNTGNVVVVDFNYPIEKRQAIIDAGYAQTMSYFKDYLVLKKQKILSVYEELLKGLRQIETFFLLRKFGAGKNHLSEMFITLAKSEHLIDRELFDAISMFQKQVFSAVRVGLLGRTSCSNKDLVFETLKTLIVDLTNRVKELEKYINKFTV